MDMNEPLRISLKIYTCVAIVDSSGASGMVTWRIDVIVLLLTIVTLGSDAS